MKIQSVTIKGKLPTANEYINACRRNKYAAAKLKSDTEILIMSQIRGLHRIDNPLTIDFIWCEKNRRRDKDNVAFAKKFILDALQKSGVLPNDNNQYIKGFSDSFEYGSEYSVMITIKEQRNDYR